MIGDGVEFDVGYKYNSFMGKLLDIKHSPKNHKEAHAHILVTKEYYKKHDTYQSCEAFEVYLPLVSFWCREIEYVDKQLPIIDSPPIYFRGGVGTIVYTIPHTNKVVARIDDAADYCKDTIIGTYLLFTITNHNELKWVKGTKIIDRRYVY